MSRRVSALALLFAASAGAPALADQVDVRATTVLQLRQDARDGKAVTVVPAITIFSLQARKVKLPLPWRSETDVVMSSWGRTDAAQMFPWDARVLLEQRAINGDVGLAYVESRSKLVSARVGRQLMFDGVARGAHVDGASAELRPWGPFGLSLYAGMPVVPLAQDHRGMGIAGGRAFYRHSFDSEVGVSGVHVMELGRTAHQDVGVDGRFQLLPSMYFAGFARWSTLQSSATGFALLPKPHEVREGEGTAGMQERAVGPAEGLVRQVPALAEADVNLSWAPLPAFQFSAGYRRTAPSLFISRYSIFSVFSAETRDQFGVTAVARIGRWGSVDGDAALIVTPNGPGFVGGARTSFRFGPRYLSTTVGAQTRALHVPTNGYLQARVFGSEQFPYGVRSTLDADVYVFEKPVHTQYDNERFTALLSWTNAVNIFGAWDVGLQLTGATSPLVARVEALARIQYNAGVRLP